ncbi:GNAT family N-acetyltransferase [Geobacter argillaceus]|uniref:Putative N-acetyltransferase YhbS n=1 Tax=Geobacter argillaceus TaxID=345631 RepID=A0A562VJX3_9BACT|nr:GNAT family N-acetyltransferase [Geobacter argillaceus]TWJ18286.1 putative N-acetyltransferase YhbS [Geobacter argillaceus]
MSIDTLRQSDIEPFLEMAAEEGWICDHWELEFLRRAFPAGCLVWREGNRPIAFVTSIKYGRSGWIGNLIVSPALRGRGTGSALIQAALSALETAGAETVWLTASTAGRPIYEKVGFQAVDTVYRWRGKAPAGSETLQPSLDLTAIKAIDRAGWGDFRELIFAALGGKGTIFTAGDGFLCRHRYADGVQLGPWGCLTPETARRLLQQALQSAGETAGTFLDMPGRNREGAKLLNLTGFRVAGSTLLMYRGRCPAYRPELIYGLASMGSFG